jgi:hypothetical protein
LVHIVVEVQEPEQVHIELDQAQGLELDKAAVLAQHMVEEQVQV